MAGILRVARFGRWGRTFWALLEGDDRAREAEGIPSAELRPIGDAPGARWSDPGGRPSPSRSSGVGRNYRAHAAELGHDVPAEPLLFLKPPSALIAHREDDPAAVREPRVDFEGSWGWSSAARRRPCRKRSALDFVLGYTCVNDVTARDLQKRDVQFHARQGIRHLLSGRPLSSRVGLDPAALAIETRLNGVVVQRGRSADMVLGIAPPDQRHLAPS